MLAQATSAGRNGLALALLLLFASSGLGQEATTKLDAARVLIDQGAPLIQQLYDFDGDARPDAVGMQRTGLITELAIYQNAGDGTFSSVWTDSVSWSSAPFLGKDPLEVADFDGDGARDDFAVAQWDELYLFQRAGQFPTVHPVVSFASRVIDIAISDLDQDGTDDLVVTCQSQVTVILAPLSATPTRYDMSYPIFGNGGSPIAAIRHPDGSSSLLLNRHRFVYSTSSGLTLDPSFNTLIGFDGEAETLDIDGDGDEDAVYSSDVSESVTIVRQGPNNSLTIETPSNTFRATFFFDLDGDGDRDGVAMADGSFWFSENQNGTLARAARIGSGTRGRLAGVADLDGDGDPDLLGGDCVYYGRGTSLLASRFDVPVASDVDRGRLADLDGDGDPDYGFSSHLMWRNDGSAHFSQSAPVISGTLPPNIVSTSMVGDWNGDGLEDLSLATLDTIYAAYNQGGGDFVFDPNPLATDTDGWRAFVHGQLVTDIDGDGDVDVIGSEISSFPIGGGGHMSIARNDGNGHFVSEAYPGEVFVACVELNGVGTKELVSSLISQQAPSVPVARMGMGASFGNLMPLAFHAMSDERSFLAEDFNGDGRTDFLYHAPLSGWQLHLGVSFMTFSASVLVPDLLTQASTIEKAGVAYRDLDGDGIRDLLLAPAPGKPDGCLFLQGLGGGAFNDTGVCYAFAPSQLDDLDGDGDLDVLDPSSGSVHLNLSVNSGERKQYGVGAAGSGGAMPVLGATGPFREGETATLRLRNVVGGAQAYLVFSPISVELLNFPAAGITAYVDPLAGSSFILGPMTVSGAPGTPGVGSLDLAFPLPAGSAGLFMHQQAFHLDAGVPSGISATQGLFLSIGL